MDAVRGTFHFHSTYSHDGRSTLPEIRSILRARGLQFSVMTEHFEDFDAATFDRYLAEIEGLNRTGDFVLIPGVEVNLAGIDTIVFPASSYDAVVQWTTSPKNGHQPPFKVLAHPSKYPIERIERHMDAYGINAVELWNQQEDGSYVPPFASLESLRTLQNRSSYRYFFGCDLHDATLTVTNVLLLPRTRRLTVDAIVGALEQGDFKAFNRATGVEFQNGPGGADLESWLAGVRRRSYRRGRALQGVRKCLKRSYRLLPRRAQKQLNDVKNFVRNKV